MVQVAEVVAEVLLQAQTDVLVEVAADPDMPSQNVDSAVAQAYLFIPLPHYNLACNPTLPLLLVQACCNRKRNELGGQHLLCMKTRLTSTSSLSALLLCAHGVGLTGKR